MHVFNHFFLLLIRHQFHGVPTVKGLCPGAHGCQYHEWMSQRCVLEGKPLKAGSDGDRVYASCKGHHFSSEPLSCLQCRI